MKETRYEMCPNSPEGSRLDLALEDQFEMALFTADYTTKRKRAFPAKSKCEKDFLDADASKDSEIYENWGREGRYPLTSQCYPGSADIGKRTCRPITCNCPVPKGHWA
ncbi:MAG: hypothetical protein ACP5IL_09965 [Syntrophobacteraceae bacterium]